MGIGTAPVVDDFALWGPRDYVQLPPIKDAWRVLDIGPGRYPLKRANVYLDHNPEILDALDVPQDKILGNLMDGLPEIEDKCFDYVWCSHVLEHVEDPANCAATLSRIARAGTIVVPSVFKESLFNFEEDDHRFLIVPNPQSDGPPIFIRYNRPYINRLKDQMVQKATCFLYRTGTHHDCTAERHLRFWFQQTEAALDVVYHWQDRLDIQVIG